MFWRRKEILSRHLNCSACPQAAHPGWTVASGDRGNIVSKGKTEVMIKKIKRVIKTRQHR